MTEMLTIEEESGTYTGSVRPHNGYYAGDFSRTPMRTASELVALAKRRRPAEWWGFGVIGVAPGA
jgi:hypothetical protein